MINILIGGDVCPIGRNLPYFREGDAARIFNDLLVEFQKGDLSIVNLECALINKNTPIVKCGPVLGFERSCINTLKQAKIDVVNLANNHVMDHGPVGLKTTLRACAESGISTVGAGKNLKEANRILVRKVGKLRIAILGMAENEFSIGTANFCGVNPLDVIDYVRNVRSQRANFDYLILLVHGGNEHYPFPSPRLKETCHFMVEMGANAIVVQHTHCAGSYEEYQNGHIFYGQGDLIFDKLQPYKSFYEGFLVKLSVSEDLTSTMNVVPFCQSNSHIGARKMAKDEEQTFLDSFKKRSLAILDDTFVQAKWHQFCTDNKRGYLNKIVGHNRLCNLLFRFLYKNDLPFEFFCKTMHLKRVLNAISCPEHREVFETILSDGLLE